MIAVLRPLMWLAVAGFIASALVHVLALGGVESPFASATPLLFIGIFVIWVPSIFVAHRLTRSVKQAEFWKAVLRGCPPWVRTGAYVLGTYAVLNFIVFMVQVSNYPRNDVPDLVSYRALSGHGMIFYYVGAATLYSAVRLRDLGPRKCPQGHDVSPFAKYCDVCGVELTSPLTP